MNRSTKRNKLKVWRKTYGKPFIKRRAVIIAQMAATSAMTVAQIGNINSSFGGAALKAVTVAECVVNFSKAVGDAGHKMNEGFVTK